MPERKLMPVIAIGASAGGLEACRALLKDMPGDVPAAFILILHLDPTHDSLMVDLLSRHTRLKVVQATNGMRVQSGRIHVIPPNAFMTVADGVVHLAEPEAVKGVRFPFDVLLQSLAKDTTAVPAAIVLSGTGTDGTLGIAPLHAAGGLVIAQDANEAGYSGMPESAIATGLVDQTLLISQIGAAIVEFVDGSGSTGAPVTTRQRHDTALVPAEDTDTTGYDDIISFLGEYAAQDISLYKRGTLERRIVRRMALVGCGPGETARYLEMLKANSEERAQLSADLLIHVTSFFRDPGAFDHLSQQVLPGLVAAMSPDRSLRIWVAGCSTGEEAYSFAILCIEAMEAAGSVVRVQILASDVDPDAIATARAGFYARDIQDCMSPERLSCFFVAQDGGYRVTSALRDVVVFTVADLLSDPPFLKIDLVSCRNVLIYLAPEAQKRVIARCCFALREGGLLMLGAAEMPGQSDTCFTIEDKESRLWRRIGQSHPGDLHFLIGRREEASSAPAETPARRGALAELCRRIVLENYAPAAVLLNSRLECLYLLGPTEKYLTVAQGHPDRSIVGMLPKALRVRFRTAAGSCSAANPLVVVSGGRSNGSNNFDIAVHAVAAGSERLLLVCFVTSSHLTKARSSPATGSDRSTGDLEADLEATRNDLSDALRDLEYEVEARGTDAAEALSVSEEFQATNEELLASKEELQSLNEELTALNSQLQETLERQRTTANDLQNVLYSTDVATLFLDLDLRIRFFTPAARTIFRVIPTDVGRPLADLAAVARDDHLIADTGHVLATHDPLERETAGVNGLWLLRRIQPYRVEGGRVEGVVITYIDITERKRTNAALMAAKEDAERAASDKSRLLASASHDLRQPLQSMVVLHRLLARPKRPAEATRLAALMDQTMNSMAAMLDSMLDADRIESGIVRPNMRPFAIGPLMQRLAEEFGPQCKLKNLKLRSVPCKAWVQTDPQLLEQILRNLLSNALKYTAKGGILLGCRRRGGLLTVHVCDSGIGVAESEQTSIFDAYNQGEKAAGFAEHGLGLGLSIVQRLAQLMEYPISLHSTPGKGSAFLITLPVVEGPAEMPALVHTAPEAPSTIVARRTGTVLLVEHDESLRDLLAEVLVNEGHTVFAKSNAQDALAWASGKVALPDLLLTDFDLRGGLNGLTLAQDLPDVLGRSVPTIVLTGDITSATVKKITASGFQQVIKPVMPEVLLAQIADLMLTARTAKERTVRRPGASRTTLHVVDDDPMVRETMRRLFQAEGWMVVTYPSAEDFLAQPRPDDRACLLVDNVLPGMDGIALIAQLRAEHSRLPAIMLTGHGDAAMAVAAMKAGASDLVEKPSSAAELLESVRLATGKTGEGQSLIEPRKAAKQRFSTLTDREREVLSRVLAGHPNKIIAGDLGINQRTVENHRASVMRKTGAASLPALVRLAFVAGEPSPQANA